MYYFQECVETKCIKWHKRWKNIYIRLCSWPWSLFYSILFLIIFILCLISRWIYFKIENSCEIKRTRYKFVSYKIGCFNTVLQEALQGFLFESLFWWNDQLFVIFWLPHCFPLINNECTALFSKSSDHTMLEHTFVSLNHQNMHKITHHL